MRRRCAMRGARRPRRRWRLRSMRRGGGAGSRPKCISPARADRMASDSPPPREGVIARIRESTAAQLWIVAAASVVFFLVFKIAGMLGDCGPHDHDGQCGMGAFVGELFGGFGAIIIWIGLS